MPFTIYNASAGSGKTYTLVKEYLTIVLGAKSPDIIRRILAITFTNKAVNEMKSRIVSALTEFSNPSVLQNPSSLFSDVSETLNLNAQELHHKATNTLQYLLHNYAFFEVSTIDKFNHRLVRTFAKDLNIPQSFQVSLDTDLILKEAVENILDKVGEDKKLTSILIDFVLYKIDDDKSWNISYDLNEIAKLLINETHYTELKKLGDKSLDDFKILKERLKNKVQKLKQECKTVSNNFFNLIEANNIKPEHFKGKYIPNYFKKFRSENYPKIDYSSAWMQNIEVSGSMYNKTQDESVKAIIDTIQQNIAGLFYKSKTLYNTIHFYKKLLLDLTPFSLLNVIKQEIDAITQENNLMLISEFNNIISDTIKNQPAPFIYERLGEKYKHYFIDEFQDTSQMQWENLVPLISNAIESEDLSGQTGSLMLVGDVKQSIYRWRGGYVAQFLNLCNNTNNPFSVPPNKKVLNTNYRSLDNIIHFNNDFFKTSSLFLNNPEFKKIFEEESAQKTNNKPGGVVSIEFIEYEKKEEAQPLYAQKTLDKIKEVTNNSGFAYNDICVLVRKNDEGIVIAEFLAENNIPVQSSESLLLQNSPDVTFLINILAYALSPNNEEIRSGILNYLSDKQPETDKHNYLNKYVKDTKNTFFNPFNFSLQLFLQLPLYEAVIYSIDCFDLTPDSDAYLQSFLDEVVSFKTSKSGGLIAFLDYWEKKRDKLSIAAPNESDAVKIMTVHKAKGLEFPIVIYPFADSIINNSDRNNIWVPLLEQEDKEILPFILTEKSKNLSGVSQNHQAICEQEDYLSELDAFNVLYVALTRAEKQLHIITKKVKENASKKTYAHLFLAYLKHNNLWSDAKTYYEVYKSTENTNSQKEKSCAEAEVINFYVRNPIKTPFTMVTRAGMLWGTPQQEAIQKGDLLHDLMSQITYKTDIENVLNRALKRGKISQQDTDQWKQTIIQITNHPELSEYFTEKYTVKTEPSIYTKDGKEIRPDRVNIQGNNAIIIDYKTGEEHENHQQQIRIYSEALEEIGFSVLKKVLVYVANNIKVKTI